MSNLIAKRYVKALLENRDMKDILIISEQLKTISSAYNYDKFLSIISSVEVTIEDKTKLIISFVENINEIVKNLILLLGKNRRLDILPDISKELNNQVSISNNRYEGIVYSNEILSQEYIDNMQLSFSKKFDVELTLKNEVCSYDGIKVDIEGLGIEIGFSQERLKSQMIEHILKAV